ncbi:diguanylate cyclase [bacterium]|nr:diguanylate cyclase [bacterium]
MGLNIRQKILLAFILVILVSGGAVFTIYSNSGQIVELTNQIIDEDMVNTHNIQKMREHLLHTDWALSRYQLTHESPWLNIIHITRGKFKDYFSATKKSVVRDREKDFILKIQKNFKRYSRHVTFQIKRFEQGLVDMDLQQKIRSQENSVNDILIDLQQLENLTAGRLEERKEQAGKLKRFNQRLSVGVILLVTLTSAFLVFILNQNIILPIKRLMEGVRKFSDGNFATQVPVISQDEVGELSAAFNEMAKNIKHDRQKLTALTITDEKTGLFNFRHFKNSIIEEMKRAERYDRSLALVMIDIDHFKHYNDTNGHPMGDLLLKELSNILKEAIRETDMVARFGGEEFIILLPETSREEAVRLAESLRLRIKNHIFPMEEKQPGKDLTVSMGVASYPSKKVMSPDTLLEKSDQALYKAKKRGRNRVAI